MAFLSGSCDARSWWLLGRLLHNMHIVLECYSGSKIHFVAYVDISVPIQVSYLYSRAANQVRPVPCALETFAIFNRTVKGRGISICLAVKYFQTSEAIEPKTPHETIEPDAQSPTEREEILSTTSALLKLYAFRRCLPSARQQI